MKFTSFVLLASIAAAAPHVIKRQSNTPVVPVPPSQDPWYTAPDGIAKYRPGTVFKVREAPGLVPAIANTGAAYQLLYRTTDSRYKPEFAVTTLLLPVGWNSASRDKLLSYQIPYDSASVDASPSYTLYESGGVFGTGEISDALSRGWAVVTADYEGPRASFTAGVMSSQFPDAEAYLQDQLVDRDLTYNKANFNAARNYSLIQSIGAFAGQNIALYFRDGFDALLSGVAQKAINSDGIMGYHGVPQAPIFLYKAIEDEISVVADTDVLVDRFCGVGATIRYERNNASNHATELFYGRARALAFLDSVFAKTYSANGCSIVNVTVNS